MSMSPHMHLHQPLGSGAPRTQEFMSEVEFEKVVHGYLSNLSIKKRDKALITRKRYEAIQAILKDPRGTNIGNAQFRFWAKKMFRIDGDSGRVCNDGKPVAVKEQLFQILSTSHRDAKHGGRDKTSAKVRQHYSWVPKELITQYVKACPTCILRRNPPPTMCDTSLRDPPTRGTTTPDNEYLQQENTPPSSCYYPTHSAAGYNHVYDPMDVVYRVPAQMDQQNIVETVIVSFDEQAQSVLPVNYSVQPSKLPAIDYGIPQNTYTYAPTSAPPQYGVPLTYQNPIPNMSMM